MHAGRIAEAIEQGNRVVNMSGRSASALGLLADVYARADNRERARTILQELLARSHGEYIPPGTIGGVYAALGEPDAALKWLERAFAERSNSMAYLLANPENAPLRGDPRFQSMLIRVGLQ
jgi:Flp pilus assembly protein TadD